MIIGIIHKGSGLGDQLFSYIITRVIALDRGFEYGFVGKEFFKGKDFMTLDWGNDTLEFQYTITEPQGYVCIDKLLPKLFTINKPYYDPEVNFIQDGTVIDGYGAQDERYWGHRLNEIREWLKVEPLEMSDKVVMNIRGGEYKAVSELILPLSYWVTAANEIDTGEVKRNVEIHTDDPDYCKELLGDGLPIIKNIETNWRSLRYAKYAVISNSAFAIIPRLLSGGITIAPKYWAGRNVGEWRRPQNYYKGWTYI